MTVFSTEVVTRALKDHGWARFDLPDPGPVFAGRDALAVELRRLTGDPAMTLKAYHRAAFDDEDHTAIQWALAKFWRRNGYAQAIFDTHRPLFESILGPAIRMQSRPYLRVARPGNSADNVGYHRDTVYGANACDVSVVFPLVDLPAASALRVLSGSHVKSDAEFPCRRIHNLDVPRFGRKHSMGFFYSPYVYDPWFEPDMESVDLEIGQALMFATSLVHGQKLNEGPATRWTTDFGVLRTVGPADDSGAQAYDAGLERRVMTTIGERYAAANRLQD